VTDVRQLCAHTARTLPTLVVCLAIPVIVRATALQPGCDPSRPAVAHHAGGVAIVPPPPGGPIPCATVTGNSSESAAVGIAPRGTVFYAPVLEHGVPAALADPALVARSRDGGATVYGGLRGWRRQGARV